MNIVDTFQIMHDRFVHSSFWSIDIFLSEHLFIRSKFYLSNPKAEHCFTYNKILFVSGGVDVVCRFLYISTHFYVRFILIFVCLVFICTNEILLFLELWHGLHTHSHELTSILSNNILLSFRNFGAFTKVDYYTIYNINMYVSRNLENDYAHVISCFVVMGFICNKKKK